MSDHISLLTLFLTALGVVCFGLAMWVLNSVSGRVTKVELHIQTLASKCEKHAERIAWCEAKVNGKGDY